jgi:hypothetical protein
MAGPGRIRPSSAEAARESPGLKPTAVPAIEARGARAHAAVRSSEDRRPLCVVLPAPCTTCTGNLGNGRAEGAHLG